MEKIVIIDYSPESGKGSYVDSKGNIKRYYHKQMPTILKPGTRAILHSDGKIKNPTGLWDRLKYYFRRN